MTKWRLWLFRCSSHDIPLRSHHLYRCGWRLSDAPSQVSKSVMPGALVLKLNSGQHAVTPTPDRKSLSLTQPSSL